VTQAGTKISDSGFTVAVVGATGAVGREMLAILAERDFPVARLRAMASARSAGRKIEFRGHEVVVEDLQDASFEGVDFGLFSAGSAASLEHGPRAAAEGCIVIDNTSAFRMDPDTPLVVPEVNPDAIVDAPGIIANPNCSTIQMVVALKPLADAAGLERVVVSTYQSASGAGQKGIEELLESTRAYLDEDRADAQAEVFAHPLAFDALAHIDVFLDSGFTREEMKMVQETRKIMGLGELEVAATCVRIPVIRSHSESVTVDLKSALSADEARELWSGAAGIRLLDDPAANAYPRARLAERSDETWVGRVRRDLDRANTLHFWVVSDNLRKGAALNAVQIAEEIVRRRG
jgi:aspartate-semialdehyde dehydrogenase